MADYREGVVQGNAWTRCYEIQITNPYQQTPGAIFREQRVALLDNKLTVLGFDGVPAPFDPAAMIDIYDPVTLLPTGQQVPQEQLYGLLFSAYLTAAKARDDAAAAAAQPEPTPEPTPEP